MNLYVHFPFCRRKCAYCALYSLAGRDKKFRDGYALKIADAIRKISGSLKSVYFGGGTPALCDLKPVFKALENKISEDCEWTVEVNPLDVTLEKMKEFFSAGVNRISMGVQSLDDSVLLAMRRGHTAEDALKAFKTIRDAGFSNAGIDIIAGYPSSSKDSWKRTLDNLCEFSPDHCSVYSLIREKGTLLESQVKKGLLNLPGDDAALNELIAAREVLKELSLERYEISSYAKKGFECRHNFAVWRGEDYLGLGDGAHGRRAFKRSRATFDFLDPLVSEDEESMEVCTSLSEEEDALERVLFRLRTREGINLDSVAKEYPVLSGRTVEWEEMFRRFVKEGIAFKSQASGSFVLTDRGMEVCDAVLSELL
jgi:oxygen-independent coproporphyrinogen-3 oxidase